MLKSVLKTLGMGLFLLVCVNANGQETPKFRLDPEKVVGSDACLKCHENEGNAWHGTHHFKTYKELHKRKEAKEIAKKLTIKRIKTSKECMSCHYTVQQLPEKPPVAISGISCESCHGAAKDWIDIHQDFGKDKDAKTEDPAHRIERLAKIDALGMIRPSNIYKVAENCYKCHTVPNESLVNKGGHKAGSVFELYTWSQGEVLHTYRSGGGSLLKASKDKKRMLYVVGQLLDLEYAFRGVAKAKEKAPYAGKMAKRASVARKRLVAILKLVKVPELLEIYKIAKAQKLKLNNEEALTKAADDISTIAQAFAIKFTGKELADIDSLIPSDDKLKGSPSE
jgi:hypothetical protein